MPTEKELEETYSQWPTENLLYLIHKKSDYTELAVSVALEELKKRKVPDEALRELQQAKPVEIKPWMENCLYDLSFLQKIAFYFLSVPVFIVQRIIIRSRVDDERNVFYLYWGPEFKLPGWFSFKSRGFLLKGQQADYYKVTGLSFLLVGIISYNATIPVQTGLFFGVWIAGFIAAFLFDAGYNCRRLRNKLDGYKTQGELPWGV